MSCMQMLLVNSGCCHLFLMHAVYIYIGLGLLPTLSMCHFWLELQVPN